MMVDAKIVFLDEVGAGVNRTLLNTIGDAIIRLNKERGYTFCMIEHDMDFIGSPLRPGHRHGRGPVLTEGTAEVMANEQVIEAYLGTGLKNRPARAAREATAAGRRARGPSMSFLIGENMTGGYGGRRHPPFLHHRVEKGEIAVIVGPNGAGKSTAMKAVFGMLPICARAASCSTARDITGLTPQDRVAAGMGFVPQTTTSSSP
jgi:ABC-type branched-subunit amino acid transport system ATPase component